mgnify:CR=1 FL=1
MTDHQIIFLKLWVNKLAVICGKVSREMASTIPTMRRHDTMVSAMNIIRIYSNKATRYTLGTGEFPVESDANDRIQK